ncbi:lactate utilization protein C [Streptomyces sp. LX-29]|uniref:LutC/YkgG family protein n=1 Tax=Streptomyces sp. LX-29 TaxID=2900152 RepID=UPI00240CFEFF|nr:lactate utilization protein C [Streptomyces sp. LX-29]WFB06468.1 lactate utilization protein C [Streptomyces sp. LX-29]
MSSRDLILARIRRALTDVPRSETPADVPVDRGYARTHGERTAAERVALLAENLADYRARVHRTDAAGLPGLLARLLADRGARTVLVPAGLPTDWLAKTGSGTGSASGAGAGAEPGSGSGTARRVVDAAERTPRELAAVDSVVTGCAVAIAETGTLVLDGGPDQGRRRVSLVPDHHVCVVRVPEQVVDSVPQALDRLDPARPLTWISGPSATSDIELNRVEGVHGPRTLDVILVAD